MSNTFNKDKFKFQFFTIIIRETLTKLKVWWYYQFNYLGENMSGFNYNVRRLYIHKMLVDLHRQNL